MLLQAHVFIVFLHPNAAMQRRLMDWTHFTRPNVKQLWQETISASPHQAVYPRGVSQFRAFDTRGAEWAWQWKIQKQFCDLISRDTPPPSISLNSSATNHKRPQLFIHLTAVTSVSDGRHQKQSCSTSSGVFPNSLHRGLFCVIAWPHPAARRPSGCPCCLRLCCR